MLSILVKKKMLLSIIVAVGLYAECERLTTPCTLSSANRIEFEGFHHVSHRSNKIAYKSIFAMSPIFSELIETMAEPSCACVCKCAFFSRRKNVK